MVARRYKEDKRNIFHQEKNIEKPNQYFLVVKGTIYYVAIASMISFCMKITFLSFSRLRM